MMKRGKRFKLKLRFPYEAIIALVFFPIAIVLCLRQYSIEGEMDYLLIAFGALIAFCFFSWLFNNTFKRLEIAGEVLTVRYWFGFNLTTKEKHDIKGYKLRETYTNQGLDYYIILIPLEGKEIGFIKNSYTNYERLESKLKGSGVRYIGTENINSPYKQMLAKVIVWCTAITSMLFFLLHILKLGK